MRSRLVIGLLAFVVTTTAQAADPAVLEIAVDSPIRTMPRSFWGLNVNYLLDGPREPSSLSDLSRAIREMGVQVLRYPGGEKSDGVWFSSPPYTRAEPTLIPSSEWPSGDRSLVDPVSGAFLRPPLSFDDFMRVSRETGAAAVIVLPYDVAYGPKTKAPRPGLAELLAHARAWAAYAKRHRFPVKAWALGNESYLRLSYNGAAAAADYARDLRAFAKAIRSVDPDARIAANGPENASTVGSVDKAAGRRGAWWKTVLNSAGDVIDFVDIHSYPVYGWGSFDAYAKRPITLRAELASVRQALRRWARPADAARIRILLSEVNSADWSGHPRNTGWSHRSSFGHGLVLAEILAIAACEPLLESAIVWNTRWLHNAGSPQLWDAIGTRNTLLPTGHALRLVSRLLRGTLFPVRNTPQGVFALAAREGTTTRLLLINRTRSPVRIALGGSVRGSARRVAVWTAGWDGIGGKGRLNEKVGEEAETRQFVLPGRSATGIESTSAR